MGNMKFNNLNYIHWKTDAKRIVLDNDQMKAKLKEVMSTRTVAKTNTKVSDYINEDTYKANIYGDWAELYMCEKGRFVIYCNNVRDNKKNTKEKIFRADRMFQQKFMEFNGCGLEKAFGFMGKTLKRCIPKQFYYVDKSICDKTLLMSSIDASSQYASGCLGRLPDAHTAILLKGRHAPTEEYPFAFYASGHCAEYGVFDTHDWLSHKLWSHLFRLNKSEPWPYRPLKDEEEETFLMKASKYTMDSTWRYFYNIKQSYEKDSQEYLEAKQVILEVMGQWHRKDKDQKRIMTYEDGGSFQLAHIVAIAIGRGNQKILNKIDEIGLDLVVHVCVDGIIYIGSEVFGQQEVDLGVFCQEFTGVPTCIRDINVYMAKNKDNYKFRHAGYDLINGEEIDEDKHYDFVDLYNLSAKERIGDIIKNG